MKQFKYFPFSEVFDYKRGVRFTEDEHIIGDIPYVSSSKDNNGINDYVAPPLTTKKGAKVIVYNNCLTISNSGSVGYLFYHNYNFIASDHVTVFWPKGRMLTKNIALYLKPVFEKIRYKYNFGREISNSRLERENILLPVDKNNVPDWNYMENYTNNITKNVKFNPIETLNISTCYKDIKKWGEFSFIDKKLWTRITHGQRLIAEDRISGDIDYYSASEFNNSQTDQISNPLFIEKNCIVYNTFASAFYVENEFTASDEIYCFHNEKLNKYNALFITTIMKKNKYKFQFGRKAFYNKFCNETIRLPITQKGDPDWQYMEDYIKSLPYADLI